ncbi:Inner membrane symporter YicJ [Pontiella desulfatans]|uniref:Inner membrane symporter YicJ n=1 Tax=Pontiella desulfatans TaxID=2750659 RepID=A0A6C2TZH7_PONDE|nr:MFS transporter [Pontiella desulfatans]VGO13005.1 Inner membrane symporter YicJ [Pontiella desulfatans]
MGVATIFQKLKTRDLWGYALGEGATSITMNGVNNFALLFYTQIMGMSPELAGAAFAATTLYDAITDPVMGTISDRTNSRFGRRHPYMLIGGLLLAMLFFFVWFVPETFQGEKTLFWYLLILNILIKTAFTVFVVPHTALGFEMCRTDEDRARVQGVRYGFNMIINIIFGGLGWMLFFPNKVSDDGTVIDGTKVLGNYLTMGSVLTVSAALLVVLCVYATYKFAEKGLVKDDSLSAGDHVKAFVHDLKDVYTDKLVWFVFGFFGLAQFSMMVVSQVQMFTYVEYMEFSAPEKTFVHTGGMVGFMLGAFLLGGLVKRLDKKKTGYAAMTMGSFGCLALLAIFTGGLMAPKSVPLFMTGDEAFHLSSVVFGLFQTMWWAGCGIIVPLATAMIADLSLVKRLKTGEVTEGRYAAGFSFFLKMASALGLFVTGYILKGVGYVSGAETQSADTLDKLALMTFIVGPILMLFSFFVLRKYPITHQVMANLRAKYGQEEQ